MVKFKIYSVLITTIFLNSCFGLWDSSSDTIIGPYNVGWIDVISSRSINLAETNGGYGGAEMVPAYVYAVGHTEKFIIAKQHPLSKDSGDKVDIKITNYFIIDISKKNYNQEGVYGPLSKKEFNDLCRKLNINLIKFDLTYPEIP